jgi:hypothetical protein
MKTHYTYTHYKPDGSIFYVGKGVGDRAFSKENRNIYWKRTVAKFGYKVQIEAYWDTDKEAKDHEKLLISCFKDMGMKLVNLTAGGDGSFGYKWTEEQLQRHPTRTMPNSMTGKKHSDETKAKIAQKAIGRIPSDETKVKISKAFKGRKFSETHLEKLRLAGLGNKNGIGNKGNAGKPAHNRKKCLIDGIVYESSWSASKALGLLASTIRYRCKSDNFSNYQQI